MDQISDLLDTPETPYLSLANTYYKPEQDLAEKYRSFVTEMLRLSLAGIAVFSFLGKNPCGLHGVAGVIAAIAVALFALSISCSLWFLYRLQRPSAGILRDCGTTAPSSWNILGTPGKPKKCLIGGVGSSRNAA
jgi:hypothetical protein